MEWGAERLQAKPSSLAEFKAEFTAQEGFGRLAGIVGMESSSAFLFNPRVLLCVHVLTWISGGGLVPVLQEGRCPAPCPEELAHHFSPPSRGISGFFGLVREKKRGEPCRVTASCWGEME